MTSAEEMLARFGSPVYVYRLEAAGRALADLRSSLPAPSTLYYSVKANPHPDLIRFFHDAGCGAEVSSAGELQSALTAGVAPRSCFYTGPAKTPAELLSAVASGVRRFSVESPADLRRVAGAASAHGAVVDAVLRVNAPGAGIATLRMTGAATQFGIDADELVATRLWQATEPGVRIVGAHLFAVSNVSDEQSLAASLAASITSAARLRAAGMPLSFVSLGGGFAAPYAVPGTRPAYQAIRPGLERALDAELDGWRQGNPEVAFESGRYLVADCGSLICTAMETKTVRESTFLLLDSGINHLGGMSGLGRLLRPSAVPLQDCASSSRATSSRANSSRAAPSAAATTITGPLCTPLDVLGRDARLAPVAPGAAVTFPNVGAYGLTASLLAFLSRPAPAEVVTNGAEIVSVSRIHLVRMAP
jgi:diaminopimelate decarboxylase